MPRVGHPWRKHFYDARFIVMEVDTSIDDNFGNVMEHFYDSTGMTILILS